MAATLKRDVREAILVAAREAAMAYGYGGINFRDLAEAVGIKAASINYYFANKAVLGEAVARRYWEDIARDLDAISGGCAKLDGRAAAVPWYFSPLSGAQQSHVPQQLHGDRI